MIEADFEDRPSQVTPGAAPRVLVATVPEGVSEKARVLLVPQGYDISFAKEPSEVETRLATAHIDLVLLDIRFPRALELLGEIRTRDATRPAAVILFSDEQAPELNVAAGLIAGADDYVQLGQRETELRARIRVRLRHRNVRELLLNAHREADELRDAVTIDELTGVSNRRAGDAYLANVEEVDVPVLLMMIDLDHFKSVNDTFGHSAGDVVIQGVAKALTRYTRDGDLVARLGGEEFVVVLRDAPIESHARIAQRFVDGIRRMTWPSTLRGRTITISVGAVSRAPRSSQPIGISLKLADDALYAAKRSGRDRFVLAPSGDGSLPDRTSSAGRGAR